MMAPTAEVKPKPNKEEEKEEKEECIPIKKFIVLLFGGRSNL